MRQIIAFNNVSADGYFATPDGGLEWSLPDPELNTYVMSKGTSDTGLFGRVTFQMFENVWPKMAADPKTPPDLKVFADSLTRMKKIVFSKSLKKSAWKNTTILSEIVPGDLERMKKEEGGDIIIFGSGTIAHQLTDHGLIDQYVFIIHPVVLGAGKSLLAGGKVPRALDLLEAKPFKSGNVLMRYARSKKPAPRALAGPHASPRSGR